MKGTYLSLHGIHFAMPSRNWRPKLELNSTGLFEVVGLTDDEVEALCEDTRFFDAVFVAVFFGRETKIVMSLNEQWKKHHVPS